MIMRDAVVEGSGNFDHLGFFNVHPNLSTRAYNISASIGNAAAAAGIRTRDLRVFNRHVDPPLSYTTVNSDECTTGVCQWNANYLFHRLPMHGDPCDDFYEHVCSAFKKPTMSHLLPYPQLSIRQLVLDLDLFMSRYSKIKRRHTLADESNFLTQAMWLHDKCKSAHLTKRYEDQQSDWADIMGALQISAWPYVSFEGDIVNVVSAGDRFLMLRSLFTLIVLRSNRNNSSCDIVLREPETYLKRYLRRSKNNPVQRYEDIIFGAITHYSNPLTGALVSRQISKLEMKLRNLTYLDSVRPQKMLEGVTSIHMLPKSDQWDWLKYMSLLFHTERNTMRISLSIVEDPVFFSQFSSIFDIENYHTAIANYVGFKAMVTLAPLMTPEYSELYELGHDYDIPMLEPQLLACTLLLEKVYRYGVGIAAKLTLSQEFTNVYRRHRDAQLQDLFNDTRAVIRPMLVFGQSWFSNSNLEQILKTLDSLSFVFGTQDNFVQYEKYRQTPPLPQGPNDTVLGIAFSMFSHASSIYWSAWNSREVADRAYDNMYHMSVFDWDYEYQTSNNLVFLPNAIVAFLTTVTNKMPFEMYPIVLVHVVRGVLKALLRTNAAFINGHVLRGGSWSATSDNASQDVLKCIQHQYREATAAEFGRDQPTEERWSIARIEEAFLEHAVMVPLYELFERALTSHNATDMFYQLPDWRVTVRRLFFYNYAVTFCDDDGNGSRKAQYLHGMTPSKWRVNVPLTNFPPFRKAFSCSAWKQPQQYCNAWRNLSS
ncbi:hypothetical protein HPB51_005014 [Rhipicephalus microplus]|uniref:Uncharacterized protein n=1 Tax=Rhipicephalus microplus TaxID=6941 RepID=A0A9J6EX05_RHIMP|nr:hypothetical protein HPB51_005014 [Rhipicephalus microplus]